MRRNALTQLTVLEAAEMQRVVRSNLGALESAIIALRNIQLAPLPAERVRRLLGITERFLP
jgi:hypothetical protein